MKKCFVLVVFVCAMSFAVTALAAPPIKVGLLAPLSGAYAREGEFIKNGMLLAFEQAGKIAGRDVEVIVEDTEIKPATGMAKVRKLVEHYNVNFTAGCYSSAVGLAVRDYAEKYQVPHVYVAGCTAIDFLTTKKSKWCRHPVYGGPSHMVGLPEFYVKELGLKKVIALSPDYAWGWSEVEYIKAAVKNAGGTVVQSFFTPFPTLDYSPYLGKFVDADVVHPEYAGADAPRLIKQFRDFGVKMQLAGSATLMPGMLEDAGLAAVGAYGAMVWYPVLKNAENIAFMKAYKDKYGVEPGLNAATSYSGTLACIDVLKRIKGNVEDKQAFLDAWHEIKTLKTPLGDFGYEPSTESSIQSVYIVKIVEKDGKPAYEIIKEVPAVRASSMLKMMGLWEK